MPAPIVQKEIIHTSKIIDISKDSVENLRFVWMHFVKLHFVPGFQVEAELQLWQEQEVMLLRCDLLIFTFRLPFSF